MPAPIPDRYSLEIRLGRVRRAPRRRGLNRPVLVRSLGPDSPPERRKQFVEAVRGAGKVSHPHLARVFAVAEVDGGAYSVSEWTGGASVADRIAAAQPIELPDFLPNASGLAGALAALHEAGVTHGSIDSQSISYSAAHAAKLGAFGARHRTDQSGDVRALSAALETALTGFPPGGPPPSERVDGVPRSLDRILRAGQSGELSADQLEKSLQAAPTPRVPQPGSSATSRRLIYGAVGLVAAAIGLVFLGLAFTPERAAIIPRQSTTTVPSDSPTSVPPTTAAPAAASIENVSAFDPFGEGGENDDAVQSLIDGDEATTWGTERYEGPLGGLKPGVGVTITTSGTPGRLEIVGLSPGTAFEVFWSDTFFAQLDEWVRVAGARAAPGITTIDLPARRDGFWLLWLTDLPEQADGSYSASLAELRFSR